MSYSRWSNSNWYSFWSTSSGETKDDQILSLWYGGIDDIVDLSYNDLVDVKSPKELAFYYESKIPIEELTEAMKYIKWFIDDVNEEFSGDKK